MTFALSARSLARLEGVHPDLVRVVRRAIELTTVDFTVLEGLRTEARQAELVAAGASQTMESRHLTGHAVDLGPLLGGEVRWDWGCFWPIAAAMQKASEELEVRVVWGGCWDRDLAVIGEPENGCMAYAGRRRAAGKKPFLDGPHFELNRSEFPA